MGIIVCLFNILFTGYDLYKAVSAVDSTKSSLKDLRDNVDDAIYSSAADLANSLNVLPSYPRISGTQRHRSNVPADSPADYYRRNLVIPFLDTLINELETR